MKRLLLAALLLLVPGLLLVLIIHGRNKRTQVEQETKTAVQAASRSWYEAGAVPLTDRTIQEAVQRLVQSDTTVLDAEQREKLSDKLRLFYHCYSQTNFEAYQRLRLAQPFEIGEDLIAYLNENPATRAQLPAGSVEKVEWAWRLMNSTNRITHMDPERVSLRVFKSPEFRRSMLKISISSLPNAGLLCYEGYVVNRPTVEDLFATKQDVLFFSSEQFFRFNDHVDRAANPTKLVGYWDPTQHEWILWKFCFLLSDDYRTLF